MNANALRGTPAELAGRLTVNGKPLGQPEISFLTRMGLGKKVDTVRTSEGRGGKPATVWEFGPRIVLKIEEAEAPAKAPPPPAIPSPSAGKGKDDSIAVTQADLKDFKETIVRAIAEAVKQGNPPQASSSSDTPNKENTA